MQETLKAWKDKFLDSLKGESGKKNLIGLIIAAVFVVVGIVLFVCSGFSTVVPFAKVLLVIMGLLAIAIAIQLILMCFVFGEDTPNFFLYDAALGKNSSADKLTPEIIGARMDVYFSRIAHSKGQLWLPGYLEKCDFGENGRFRTIAAYKMLLDLAEIDSEGGWKCFSSCAPATVEWIAASLQSLEPAMMKDILYIKAKFGADPSKIRGCLMKNAAYLRRRMTQYVVLNIRAFDGIK